METNDDYITAWSEGEGNEAGDPAESAVKAAETAKKAAEKTEESDKEAPKSKLGAALSDIQEFVKTWNALHSVNDKASKTLE